MRFLILTQFYPPEVGAAQSRLSSFARELRAGGHDVEVVTALANYPMGRLRREDRGRLRRRETIDGIPVTRVWLYPASGAGMRRLISYLSFTVTGLIGAQLVRRPDVVFVESPPLFLGLAGWIVAKRFRAAMVLNVSDLWPDSVRDLGLLRRGPWLSLAEKLETFLYRRATAVTAVTEGIRRRLTHDKGVLPERVLFLPNGVDTEIFRPISLPAADDSSRPAVAYTGNHGLAQGLDVVVDAAAHASEIDFVLVGAGSDKPRLQKAVADRKLQNVIFRPPVPESEISAIYGATVAGLATLRRSALMEDARPAKVGAIMACGRPVIYSGSGEGAELVRAANGGIVVEPEDGRALAEAARQIVADPAGADRMGAQGRAFVQRELAWPQLVDGWLRQLMQARSDVANHE